MDNNKNGLFFGLVGVATLVVAIIGATYAFFTATATNDTTIKGEAASASLQLTVTENSTQATGKMVPQLDAYIQKAVTGTGAKSCVDGNGNTVCKVYTISVKNSGTSTAVLKGTFTLTANTMTNLKWTKGTSATSGFTGANAKSVTDLTGGDVSVAAGATQTYYVVVWISETGSSQNTSDTGSFTGTVSFNAANGGVTSTFKS